MSSEVVTFTGSLILWRIFLALIGYHRRSLAGEHQGLISTIVTVRLRSQSASLIKGEVPYLTHFYQSWQIFRDSPRETSLFFLIFDVKWRKMAPCYPRNITKKLSLEYLWSNNFVTQRKSTAALMPFPVPQSLRVIFGSACSFNCEKHSHSSLELWLHVSQF